MDGTVYVGIFVAIMLVHGLQVEHYISPFSDMRYVRGQFSISNHFTLRDEDCILLCITTPTCVAINLGPIKKEKRQCNLKDHLVTLEKWLSPAPGTHYFYLAPPPFNRTGCFKHNTRKNFVMITHQYRSKYNTWQDEDFPQMITGCAAMAWRRRYELFGIEYGGECWATHKNVDYQADGMGNDNDTAGCIYDIGVGNNRISVFEFL